jgi:hypothetical protein
MTFGSYGGAFLAYLVFVNSFLFASVLRWTFLPEFRTDVFGTSLHPALITPPFVVELLFQYSGEAAILGLSTYGLLTWLRNREFSQTIMASVIVLIAWIPLSNVLSGSYWVGGMVVGRVPPFVWALLCLPAGQALAQTALTLKTRKKTALILVVLLVFSFACISSYHAGGVNLPTMSAIPVTVTFPTESGATSHSFLLRAPTDSKVYADQWTVYYFWSDRGLFSAPGLSVSPLVLNGHSRGYYILNWEYLAIGTETLHGDAFKATRASIPTSQFENCLLDDGAVTIYYVP